MAVQLREAQGSEFSHSETQGSCVDTKDTRRMVQMYIGFDI